MQRPPSQEPHKKGSLDGNLSPECLFQASFFHRLPSNGRIVVAPLGSWAKRNDEGICKSGRVSQSCVHVLRRAHVRDRDGASCPFAFRELDHVPPYLLDLRNGARRVEYANSFVRAGFTHGGFDNFRGGSCRHFPSRHHSVHSSSSCGLILRPTVVFPGPRVSDFDCDKG